MLVAGEVVLDPFTTACKLALLSHYPEGTKVFICDNEIDFTKPTSVETVWRAFQNAYVGSRYSRSALFNLRKPLIRSLLWYHDQAPTIFKGVSVGLQRLIDIYARERDGGLAVETLKYCLATLQHSETSPMLLDIPTDQQRTEHLERLRSLWSRSEVDCIETWFLNLEQDVASKEQFIKAIENFLSLKQPQLGEVIGDTAV